MQASRKRELVAPGLELGCAAVLRREGGQKGAWEGEEGRREPGKGPFWILIFNLQTKAGWPTSDQN